MSFRGPKAHGDRVPTPGTLMRYVLPLLPPRRGVIFKAEAGATRLFPYGPSEPVGLFPCGDVADDLQGLQVDYRDVVFPAHGDKGT